MMTTSHFAWQLLILRQPVGFGLGSAASVLTLKKKVAIQNEKGRHTKLKISIQNVMTLNLPAMFWGHLR